jgi:UDP-N-acetylglucosamine 2-epimerase (non-hydrolysing)
VKVITILGTRPEIIRLSLIIPRLDRLCDHVLVHTGQNSDPTLSDVFFRELDIRAPDYSFNAPTTSFAEQVGQMFVNVGRVLESERPDAMLVLGDTNSGLCAILAKRAGIPVFHMEAGNRSYDDRVPEEVNRRIIDHASTVLMPYTQRSKENLTREGIPSERIFVTGNPIFEVLSHYHRAIDSSDIHERLAVKENGYFLVTFHRAETVDVGDRLRDLLDTLARIRDAYAQPILCSLHPRTRDRMAKLGVPLAQDGIRFLEPLDLFDFVRLEKKAFCVLTDSGTVQEECAIFHVPSVTLREVTERPETLEAGSNMLAGLNRDDVLRALEVVLSSSVEWEVPIGYLDTGVTDTVVKLILRGRLRT